MPLNLICHPDFPANGIIAIEAEVELQTSMEMNIVYRVFGDIENLELLDPVDAKRSDYLWQQTCFEAFIGVAGSRGYLELNLSPSTEWAVYAFEDHRRGMRNPNLVREPKISSCKSGDQYELSATIDLTKLPEMESINLEMALTAVINEKSDRKSLWALAHPSGNPDFHNRVGFAHVLGEGNPKCNLGLIDL